MKIGLIDVDNRDKLNDCFPNLCLMKLSAWHKSKGDSVEWYDPLFGGHYDRIYMSKVFSFTPDYEYFLNADEIFRGGSGYAIKLVDGKEVYDKSLDLDLDPQIEHIYPDYSIYFSPDDFDANGKLTKLGIKHRETAFGYMSRGCPRGCHFCHVKDKEGLCSVKVADLDEFWRGQKIINLNDPNTLACKDWKDILTQLKNSGAKVDFNQGLDIRMMTEEKAHLINDIKTEAIHFAWDRWQDKELIQKKFIEFRKISKISPHNLQVFMLTNYDTTHEQDLYRVEWLKANGYAPYVTIYNKASLPKGHITRQLQRYCNMRAIFWSLESFEEYKKKDKWKEVIKR